MHGGASEVRIPKNTPVFFSYSLWSSQEEDCFLQ